MATWTNNLSNAGTTLTGGQTITNTGAQRVLAAYRIKMVNPAATDQQVWAEIDKDMREMVKQTTKNIERQQQEAAITISDIS